MIRGMFVRKKLDVRALSETRKVECELGCMSGRISGVERGRAREGVALIVCWNGERYLQD